MTKVCSQCGSTLSDDSKFCKVCGNILNKEKPNQDAPSQDQIESQDLTQFKKTQVKQTKKKSGKKTVEKVPSGHQVDGKNLTPEQQAQYEELKKKRENKYIIGPNQRKTLVQHIIPLLTIGSFVWFLGEYAFSTHFREFEFLGPFLALYIIMVIADVIIFVMLYKVSKQISNFLGIVLFLAFCFMSGGLSLPIVMLTPYEHQVHMFITLSLSADVIVWFMAIVLKDNYFAKGHVFEHVFLFTIGCVGALIIFIFALDIHNFALTIPIAISALLIVGIMIMFYGVLKIKIQDNNQWVFVTVNILIRIIINLLISAIFIAIAVVIVLLCAAAGDGGGIDLGGGWGSGSSSGSVSKKKKNLEKWKNMKIE